MPDEKIFSEMYRACYIGSNYERYKILVFVEGPVNLERSDIADVLKIFSEVAA